MGPIDVLRNALQDIIEETFSLCQSNHINLDDLKDIRGLAQNALNNYKKEIPKPEFKCPKNFIVGEDFGKFPACERCQETYKQVCGMYNYAWYKEV